MAPDGGVQFSTQQTASMEPGFLDYHHIEFIAPVQGKFMSINLSAMNQHIPEWCGRMAKYEIN
jgi:hypothetical protein